MAGQAFVYPLESGHGKNGHIIHPVHYTKLQCHMYTYIRSLH